VESGDLHLRFCATDQRFVTDILIPDRVSSRVLAGLTSLFTVHHLPAAGADAFLAEIGSRIRGLARGGHAHIDRSLLDRLPHLEIIASCGVGYDGIDVAAAAERGVIVTNTPDVLTEEVADTAIGLLLMTVRELSAAERHLRAGKWATDGPYPLSASLRDRAVGIVGLGRIGLAIARRLDAMKVPIAYHSRRPVVGAPYRYVASLRDMAAEVDVLLVVVPGGPATRNLIDAHVLEALGPDGIFINMGRGSVVDEPALIDALKNRTIRAAGLDVFANEPHVPPELIDLPNAVLLPHVGSASVYTRDAMGQLVVDNLKSWFQAGRPLTPVPETPWPMASRSTENR
jgi:lactate dehydrogenase-like 2-hydroxyacid dehydrogenase